MLTSFYARRGTDEENNVSSEQSVQLDGHEGEITRISVLKL